uniref:Uncharacterized protein n=1 Tax=Romanomermis culicivorax TaxID=13658 RepID=A0A915I9R8_ROMCU
MDHKHVQLICSNSMEKSKTNQVCREAVVDVSCLTRKHLPTKHYVEKCSKLKHKLEKLNAETHATFFQNLIETFTQRQIQRFQVAMFWTIIKNLTEIILKNFVLCGGNENSYIIGKK